MTMERGHVWNVMKAVGDVMGEEVQPTAQSQVFKVDFEHVHGYFVDIQRVVSNNLKDSGRSFIGKSTKQLLLHGFASCNVHVHKERCHPLSKKGDSYRESPCHIHGQCLEG